MKNLYVFLISAILLFSACEIYPHNTMKDCTSKCLKKSKPEACMEFCRCIHERGEVLDTCLYKYDKAPVEKLN